MIVDAGDLPVAGGGRLQPGRLFRVSGALAAPEDLDVLAVRGVTVLVDLRGPSEDRSVLEDWAEVSGARYVACPIEVLGGRNLLGAVLRSDDPADARAAMQTLYAQIVDDNGPALGGAVRAMTGPGPFAFGCAAGKDRTGILAALLQRVLGAGEEDVIASYTSSPPSVHELLPVLSRGYGHVGPLGPGAEVLLSAEPDVMRATLAHVETRYGGPAAYLRSHGVSDVELAALRATLVG